jgi:hypothetical protein
MTVPIQNFISGSGNSDIQTDSDGISLVGLERVTMASDCDCDKNTESLPH